MFQRCNLGVAPGLTLPSTVHASRLATAQHAADLFCVTGRQWVLLPVIPAAWLVFGCLLMAATAVTKALLQPPLYAHRPIAMFGAEFARWWLVQRLVGLTNMLFAEQLRGTPFLAWWFRALVRHPPLSPAPCLLPSPVATARRSLRAACARCLRPAVDEAHMASMQVTACVQWCACDRTPAAGVPA